MAGRNLGILVVTAALVCGGVPVGLCAERTVLWSKLCASCHDGKTAPAAEAFRAAYKTVDDFTAAVKAKGAQCMNIVKNDEKMIRRIAAEIGIRNGKE